MEGPTGFVVTAFSFRAPRIEESELDSAAAFRVSARVRRGASRHFGVQAEIRDLRCVAAMDASLDRYYVTLGAAFARGRLGEALPASALADDEKVFREGLARGLKMHKFKRLDGRTLVRVRRVLSMLTGLSPESLLDVGSGRGAFLWPLLDAFPDLEVTAIDMAERRAADLAAVTRGGIERLAAKQMDATALAFEDGAFDGVTLLEVLEHMQDPGLAVREAVRVARRFVIATVPSKADDNPEHIHLFDASSLGALFEEAGARRVATEYVPGHIVALAILANRVDSGDRMSDRIEST